MQLMTDEWMILLCQQIAKNGKHIYLALLWKLWLIITYPSMHYLAFFRDQDTISSFQFPISSSPDRINIASNQFWVYYWASSPCPVGQRPPKGDVQEESLSNAQTTSEEQQFYFKLAPDDQAPHPMSGAEPSHPAEESHFQCVRQIRRQTLTNHLFKLFSARVMI